MGVHVSRCFGPDKFAPECGCPVTPCGHVDMDFMHPDCPQHGIRACKTLRSIHPADACPADVSEQVTR